MQGIPLSLAEKYPRLHLDTQADHVGPAESNKDEFGRVRTKTTN